MRKIPESNFSQQRRKEKSLLLVPLDVSQVIWHGKSWGCVYQEVFEKQSLIINVIINSDFFSRIEL